MSSELSRRGGLRVAASYRKLVDEAKNRPEVVAELSRAWSAWANRVGVISWERVQEIYRRDGKGDPTG